MEDSGDEMLLSPRDRDDEEVKLGLPEVSSNEKGGGSFTLVESEDESFFQSKPPEPELKQKASEKSVNITSSDVIIVASFRLPVTLVKGADGKYITKSSNSMLYPTLHKLKDLA